MPFYCTAGHEGRCRHMQSLNTEMHEHLHLPCCTDMTEAPDPLHQFYAQSPMHANTCMYKMHSQHTLCSHTRTLLSLTPHAQSLFMKCKAQHSSVCLMWPSTEQEQLYWAQCLHSTSPALARWMTMHRNVTSC